MAASSSDQPSYYSADDVAQHNNAGDLWMIIDQDVYDLSDFIDEHPVLLSVAGKDATKKFRKYHRDSLLNRYKERLQVGVLRPLSTTESRSGKLFAWLRKK